MGRWFPDYRTGTPEQCAEYRDAHVALFRNGRYEQKAGIREESPRYLDLNDRAGESGAPLHPVQRWWHWNRAIDVEDRDFSRLQTASDRQDRDARKGRTR